MQRQNEYFGDAFGHASAALRPVAAAAAIDGLNRRKNIKFIIFLLRRLLLQPSLTNLALNERRTRRRRNNSFAAPLLRRPAVETATAAPQLERFYTVPYVHALSN